ncbi:hypothetical protein C8Q75DRAFT_735385 [Abortiporus biennis]|nr:hypothetical protein C8Q75DRAFT_735385 [Abortiporus biennis]
MLSSVLLLVFVGASAGGTALVVDLHPTHILPRRDGGRRNRRRPVAISCKQSNRNNVQDPTSSSRMFHPETPRFWANCNRELQSGNGKITEKVRNLQYDEPRGIYTTPAMLARLGSSSGVLFTLFNNMTQFRRIIDEESDNNKGNLELYDKTVEQLTRRSYPSMRLALSQMVPIYFNEKHTTDSVYQENHLCHSYAYDCRGEDCQLSILQQYSEFVTVICLQRYHSKPSVQVFNRYTSEFDRTFGNRRLRAKVDTGKPTSHNSLIQLWKTLLFSDLGAV